MNVDLFGVTLALPSLGQVLFMTAAGFSILGSIMMVTRRNAVHSALWLVLVFFQLAIMYVMLGAEFLAALQVLVYTGAILVLFLFVVMLLGLREGPTLGGLHQAQVWAAWPVGLLLALQLVAIVLFSAQPQQAHIGDTVGATTQIWSNEAVLARGGNVAALGQTLYTQFIFPFEVASLILLLAVVGAIVLARKEEPVEVEEVLPAIGITLGRRSVAHSPQEDQIEKKLLPTFGYRARHATETDREEPLITQPSGVGAGTTSGVEADVSNTESRSEQR
jgi:NADH-quinone oxidoreductase subunit J